MLPDGIPTAEDGWTLGTNDAVGIGSVVVRASPGCDDLGFVGGGGGGGGD